MSLHEQTTLSHESYSYEPFAKLIKRIDSEFLSAARPSKDIAVLATGPGNDISLLYGLGKFLPEANVVGVDIDAAALTIADRRMQNEGILEAGHKVTFIHGSAESVPEIPDASQNLVVGLNFIHLTDAEKVIQEAARILKPGGTFMMNTAYEKNGAYPPGSDRMWGMVVILARMDLKRNHGISSFEEPVDLLKYSAEDFVTMAIDAGMSTMTNHHIYELNQSELEAIAGYEGFAEGAMPGIPVQISAPALVKGVEPMLKRFGKESAPRGWFSMIAHKDAA